MRHNFTFNSTWDVPLGPGKYWGSDLQGAAATLLGGWQLSGLLRIGSSSPFTISAGSRNWSRNGSTTPSERPDLVPGRSSNPVLGSPDRWYDPTAFQVPELGFYGNLGRNTVSGPDSVTVDFSVLKNIGWSRILEQFRLQFRPEFFNILNRANFDVPQARIFDRDGRIVGNAGRITAMSTSARQIQFGLKLFG